MKPKTNSVDPITPGFLFAGADWLVETANIRLNAVEWFKWLFVRFCRTFKIKHTEKCASNYAIDVFIFLKWIAVGIIWINGQPDRIKTGIVVYLLILNLFTYFYHHIWKFETIKGKDVPNLRRRLVYSIVSYLFSLFCFAYLYSVPFRWGILVPVANGLAYASISDCIILSISNSMAATFNIIIKDTIPKLIASMQLVNSMIFLSMIIAATLSSLTTDEGINNNDQNR